MEARMDIYTNTIGKKFIGGLVQANTAISGNALPQSIAELVKIRASQINGCSFCLDMHTKDALAAGEDQKRVIMVGAWKEANCFTEAERVALRFTEAITRITDDRDHVDDELWAEVTKHFDEDAIAELVGNAALINAFNRINAALHAPGGDYVPGQFD
ncbi:carboxymuconolactone decarboxylase family protein [Haloglycomyces albus]|uniref:carboxymuconolactone decarboxylase family protein n=1 Tax=Haloglycomyces albus TaxID=526067 RepID=UPI00046D5A5E|nr:carboxymuconolactone decarboxylase family protein [Haloglycomyces albus]